MWTPDISGIGGPRYLALASAIAEAINSGELAAGTQLPPQRELAEKLGVTVGTVGRAYMVVKKRELVSGEVGRGTFVKKLEDKGAYANFLPERKPGTIDLACFRIPVDDIVSSLANSFAEVANHTVLLPLIAYPPASGFTTHRTAGAAWISRTGLNVPPERVIVCNGGQQALLTAIMTLASLGGPILSERQTYSGLKSIAALREIPLEPVDMDKQGIMPEALEAGHKKSGGRIVYVQPTVHNPLGCTMSMKRREKIAEIARAYDLIIIEDDVAAAGVTERDVPIAALAPERTIYITSMSKCVSPALRAGFMAAPTALVEPLSNTIHTLSLANPPLIFETASVLIMDGVADKIARQNNEELSLRHNLLMKELKGLNVSHNPAAFFAWLNLPDHWTSSEFSDAVQRAGVSVVQAENFNAGGGEAPRGVRISLNPQTNMTGLKDALRIIRKVAEEHPSPRFAVV